jgi:cell division protein FtsQ
VRRGDHLLAADLVAMKAALERHPWVRSAETCRRWPPAVAVKIRERVAAALVDLGGLYLVDEDGYVFKRAAAGDGLDLPVVTGIGRADYVQRRAAVEPMLKDALALVRTWREGPRDVTMRLSEIHVDPVDGTTLYIGDEGTQVRLGTGDLNGKLARLDRILAIVRAEGRKAEVLHLDNRVHPSWVTVRLAAAEPAKGIAR